MYIVDREYSKLVIEHAVYTPISGSSLLYVAIVPLVDTVSTTPEGFVMVIEELTDEKRIFMDWVNSDVENVIQVCTTIPTVCLFFLLPSSVSERPNLNLHTLSANSAKALKSSMQLQQYQMLHWPPLNMD